MSKIQSPFKRSELASRALRMAAQGQQLNFAARRAAALLIDRR
jgi:hypothetical protein